MSESKIPTVVNDLTDDPINGDDINNLTDDPLPIVFDSPPKTHTGTQLGTGSLLDPGSEKHKMAIERLETLTQKYNDELGNDSVIVRFATSVKDAHIRASQCTTKAELESCARTIDTMKSLLLLYQSLLKLQQTNDEIQAHLEENLDGLC